MLFRSKIENMSRKTGSNLVLALDFPSDKPSRLLSRSIEMLESVHPYVCAVKLNRQLILPLGLFDGVQKILKVVHDQGLPAIMDCKINDIGYTNQAIAEYYYKAGFDAVTANPFVGWKSGLQPVFEVAEKMRRGVILLVYMSHEGVVEGYGQTVKHSETGKLALQYIVFAEKALMWNADGAVVGATYPNKIKEIHEILGDQVPIYSPGIGAQGGNVKSAVKAGAKYLIVGRAITRAESPAESAKQLCKIVQRCLK
ncbi:MAG: orotidine 5'-phosphate decarboxylase [Thermoproteota archaeon]|nr:orotidine 5'-phosphate decarboxylase [Thermoproteota archaeon]